jgi:hypothetical protein
MLNDSYFCEFCSSFEASVRHEARVPVTVERPHAREQLWRTFPRLLQPGHERAAAEDDQADGVVFVVGYRGTFV